MAAKEEVKVPEVVTEEKKIYGVEVKSAAIGLVAGLLLAAVVKKLSAKAAA